MPRIKVLTTVWTCATCPASLVHNSSAESPVAEEFRISKGWAAVNGALADEELEWLCPRCKQVVAPNADAIAAALDVGIRVPVARRVLLREYPHGFLA